MSAVVRFQKKKILSEIEVKKQFSNENTRKESPDALRLFVPRQVAISDNENFSSTGISNFKRPISFFDHNEFISHNQSIKLIERIIHLCDNGDDSKFDDDTSSHSPTFTIISTDATPNSITDELTNILEPYEVQKKLLKKVDISIRGEKDENPLTLGVTTKRSSENGVLRVNSSQATIKKMHNSSTLMSQDFRSKGGYENGLDKPSTSNSTLNVNSNRKRLISDRREQDKLYSRVERSMLFYNNWHGCPYVNGRNSGVGLHNPMNNCFLNSVLQAVVHIPQLTRMVLESKDAQMCTVNTNEQCFHCVLKKHIIRAMTSHCSFNPVSIQQHLRRIFPHHRNGVQEDAHEMLTLLLGALEPLQQKTTINGIKTGFHVPSTPIEQIFGGNLRNELVCNVCKHKHTNYERIREMNLGLTRNGRTNLQVLIEDFFRDEQVQNFYCTKCKKKLTATRKTCLISSPVVLIIQLKRFNMFGGKNRTPVLPNVHIELSKFSFKNEKISYHLHGLIQHIGGGLNFGHYVCVMRGFDNKWYLFDDSQRTLVSQDHVVHEMEPYILIYTMNDFELPRRLSFDGNHYHRSYAKQQRLSIPTTSTRINMPDRL